MMSPATVTGHSVQTVRKRSNGWTMEPARRGSVWEMAMKWKKASRNKEIALPRRSPTGTARTDQTILEMEEIE